MGTFKTTKTLKADPALIPVISNAIVEEFKCEGYDTKVDVSVYGGSDISLSKGGIFKSVLGMKSALKVTLIPKDDCIFFEAGVGIFGQQAIPTAISMLLFWPVLLTQLWGMIQQSQLDEKALAIAERAIANNTTSGFAESRTQFCPSCGKPISETSNFCPHCGSKLI